VSVTEPPTDAISPLDAYTQKVQRSAARGLMYRNEIVPLLTGPDGSLVEHDFDSDGRFAPVERPRGRTTAGIVTGVISAPTERHPESMTRWRCSAIRRRRSERWPFPSALVVAALDLAEARGLPVEWFALSSGPTISMESGTENMDAVARRLRRLITFTHGGGEVNIVVAGINVGAQPYWHAEATMFLHTKGIRVMTPDSPFTTVGDIFSAETNKHRKKPFDIRTVIDAAVDSDHASLERWAAMADADTAVVVDAHLGGCRVTVIGIESRPIARRGYLPTDGPDQFTAGTLFPQSSKKVSRAINAASGNRPLVVLANLSGFDGSPESLRNIQWEYGAEIGRAIVNFDGPMVFCVVSRYHGGAFVVFSGALNDNMEVVAVEGSFASVIGGVPAAAVVFTRDVNARAGKDPRVTQLDADLAAATDDAAKGRLRARSGELWAAVRSEKPGEVAAEFEHVHNIERAQAMGSLHAIIPAAQLRPHLVGAAERGMAKLIV
jgi:hypothetical protein